MSARGTRGTFSVSREFWRQLCVEADRRDIKPAQLVEIACADLSDVDLDEVRNRMEDARLHMLGRTRGDYGCEKEIEVDGGMAARIDHVAHVRSAYRGRSVTSSDVLDAAINGFLDAQRWPRDGGAR